MTNTISASVERCYATNWSQSLRRPDGVSEGKEDRCLNVSSSEEEHHAGHI